MAGFNLVTCRFLCLDCHVLDKLCEEQLVLIQLLPVKVPSVSDQSLIFLQETILIFIPGYNFLSVKLIIGYHSYIFTTGNVLSTDNLNY